MDMEAEEEEIPTSWYSREGNTTYVINVSLYRDEISDIEIVQTQRENRTEHVKRYMITRHYPTYDITVEIEDIERSEFQTHYYDEMAIKINWMLGESWFYYNYLKETIEKEGVIKTQKQILKELKERISKLLNP
jgi:hypothetical protein